MIGVIGGTGLQRLGLLEDVPEGIVETPYGDVIFFLNDKTCFIPRHGIKHDTPAHRVNHKANLKALEAMGVREVVGVSSVGALKEEIKPHSIIIPDDYMDFTTNETFFDNRVKHITPGFDGELRDKLISAARKIKLDVLTSGVYVQTRGPRLETKAEVRALRSFGDVVGMTVGSEATLARELDLKYACVCSVDNYAHGVVEKPLDFEKVMQEADKNRDKIELLIREVILG
jgi:5'-methylthioadenosine phosphorylase